MQVIRALKQLQEYALILISCEEQLIWELVIVWPGHLTHREKMIYELQDNFLLALDLELNLA